MKIARRKELIQAGLGNLRLDLLIENIKIVNVYSGKVESGALGILDDRVVSPYAFGYSAKRVVDGKGMYESSYMGSRCDK